MSHVFITGGTGYLGRRLIPELLGRGHRVRALTRPGSAGRLPEGCEPILGNALEGSTFAGRIAPAGTLVHLVGVSHPAPWKGKEFERVDLASVRASAAAAVEGGIRHLVYVSVAGPAPLMKAYQRIRRACEERFRQTGIPATFVRPWYVLGPGHRWPYALIPLYALVERLPGTRDTARRLGLVKLPQMIAALVRAVESPPEEVRVVDVPEIRGS